MDVGCQAGQLLADNQATAVEAVRGWLLARRFGLEPPPEYERQ
jgi:hypothetical protein